MVGLNLNWIPSTMPYSSEFLRTKIMTSSIFNRGILTIMSNLLYNFNSIVTPQELRRSNWFLEYANSTTLKLFVVKFSDFFHGIKFQEACLLLYSAKSKSNLTGILLIGVRTFNQTHRGEILINPLNYSIQVGDYAIVFAQSKSVSQFVSNYTDQMNLTTNKMWMQSYLSSHAKKKNIFRHNSKIGLIKK